MEAERFDALTWSLSGAGSRRAVLRRLGAATIAGVLALVGSGAARATHTPADCRHNGVRCTAGSQCCSGRCVRKQGTNKRFCRQAPGQGICTIEDDACVFTTACDEGPLGNCHCYVTWRGYSFCGGTSHPCFACNTHAECETRAGGQPGDRCVQCLGVCAHTNDRACVHQCPTPATP